MTFRSEVTFGVVKLFAAELYKLYILANLGCVVVLFHKADIRKHARQIESVPKCRDIQENCEAHHMHREGSAKETQNDRPPGFVINLEICEKFSHC